jgi:hypothetical protein
MLKFYILHQQKRNASDSDAELGNQQQLFRLAATKTHM